MKPTERSASTIASERHNSISGATGLALCASVLRLALDAYLHGACSESKHTANRCEE